ncbi:MAG: o-succinylbenzoate synthase [Candidatus Tectomicrobia bacterium]|nr:o-succinylbenzoate synthase [Candidatus Tectomicrobia bacterium]
MKVEQLSWTPYRIPFRRPYATSHGSEAERCGFLVRLTTNTGRVGLGEAAPVAGSGARVRKDVATLLETATLRLKGQPPEAADDALGNVDHLHPVAVAAARCAVHTAVCDALSQAAGTPVARWLAGQAAETVPVNATIALPDAASAAEAAAQAQSQGFTCVKLKVGMAESVEAERERVAAVQNAIGERLKLRLDANGAWDETTAVATLRALEGYDLEFVEQPVACGNLPMMRRVRQAVNTPIAADEDVTSPEQAARLLRAGAAQILVIKPMVVGGLRLAREIISTAQSYGADCVVTTSIDTGIGIAAALHLAATLPPPAPACGLATSDLLATDLLASPLPVRGGHMRLPDAPGLGVLLDEEALTRCSRMS